MTGKEGVSGFRNGFITNALFNRPSSIAIYTRNSTSIGRANYIRPVFVKDDPDCFYVNKNNYTSCVDTSVTPISIIDPLHAIFIDFTPNDTLNNLKANETIGHKMVYIADTGNHCIRSLDLDECKCLITL